MYGILYRMNIFKNIISKWYSFINIKYNCVCVFYNMCHDEFNRKNNIFYIINNKIIIISMIIIYEGLILVLIVIIRKISINSIIA